MWQTRRNSLRRKEFDLPFPVSPSGKAGVGGFPPRRKHATRQQRTLARIDAIGSPHKRGWPPLCIPRPVSDPVRSADGELGTFYLARFRNFLFCQRVDIGLARAIRTGFPVFVSCFGSTKNSFRRADLFSYLNRHGRGTDRTLGDNA